MATGGPGPENDTQSDESPGQPGGVHFTQQNFSLNVTANRVNIEQIRSEEVNFTGPIIILASHANLSRRDIQDNPNDQALFDLPPPEDMSHHFSEEDLERELEEKHLIHVAKSCDENSKWRWLARKLSLDVPTINRIYVDYSDNVPEIVYQLLITWTRRQKSVKIHQLIKVLSECRMKEQALALNCFFRSILD